MTESVLIVGAGSGLSASLARLCSSKGMKVVLAARNIEKLQDLKKEIGANTIKCDATNIKSVTNLFKKTDKIKCIVSVILVFAYLIFIIHLTSISSGANN